MSDLREKIEQIAECRFLMDDTAGETAGWRDVVRQMKETANEALSILNQGERLGLLDHWTALNHRINYAMTLADLSVMAKTMDTVLEQTSLPLGICMAGISWLMQAPVAISYDTKTRHFGITAKIDGDRVYIEADKFQDCVTQLLERKYA